MSQQLGGGVLSDVWRAEERGKSISIYSLAPLLGPAVGPIGESLDWSLYLVLGISQGSGRGYHIHSSGD
jgi:hypothetical protein